MSGLLRGLLSGRARPKQPEDFEMTDLAHAASSQQELRRNRGDLPAARITHRDGSHASRPRGGFLHPSAAGRTSTEVVSQGSAPMSLETESLRPSPSRGMGTPAQMSAPMSLDSGNDLPERPGPDIGLATQLSERMSLESGSRVTGHIIRTTSGPAGSLDAGGGPSSPLQMFAATRLQDDPWSHLAQRSTPVVDASSVGEPAGRSLPTLPAPDEALSRRYDAESLAIDAELTQYVREMPSPLIVEEAENTRFGITFGRRNDWTKTVAAPLEGADYSYDLQPYISRDLVARLNLHGSSVVGAGKFGSVCLAKNNQTGQMVVIKKMPKDKPDTVTKAKTEYDNATIAATLPHFKAHCVWAKACFEDEENVYIEYELIIGTNGFNKVEAVLVNPGLSTQEKAAELIDACNGMLQAIYALHRDERVHRDIHLGNFIYVDDGATCLTDLATMKRSGQQRDFDNDRYKCGINLRWIYRRAQSKGIDIPEILEMAKYHETHRESGMPLIPRR